jgi:hypothetical protein
LWCTKWQLNRFFSEYFGFSIVHMIPPMLHTHSNLHSAVTRRTKGETWAPCKKQCYFGRRRALDRKVLPFFLIFIPEGLVLCTLQYLQEQCFKLESRI